jgi:hypothetical protein
VTHAPLLESQAVASNRNISCRSITRVIGECKPFKLRISRVCAVIHRHLSSFLQAFRRRSFFPPSIVAGEPKSLERINPGGDTKRVSRSLGQVRLGPRCRSPRARSTIPPRTPFSRNATRVASCTLPRQTRCRALELGTARRVLFLHG